MKIYFKILFPFIRTKSLSARATTIIRTTLSLNDSQHDYIDAQMSVALAVCSNAERCFLECCYAEWHYVQCCCAEYCYAECCCAE